MASEQQFCLKWNNHRSTLFSVFDSLLEEESLVDVTLTAEGQFIRAHRVILSACSPYFKAMFREPILSDKIPLVFLKDVDFENLKALVEYMYKGEANVPQHMLPSFIRTAESLQIRGLAESANRQMEAERLSQIPSPPNSLLSQLPPGRPMQNMSSPSMAASQPGPQHSTPTYKGEGSKKRGSSIPAPPLPLVPPGIGSNGSSGGGILAQHLSKSVPPPFDFHPETLLPRHPSFIPPPPNKKSRKSEPRPSGSGANHLNSPPPPQPPPGLKDLPPFLPLNREDRLQMIKNLAASGFNPPKAVVNPRLSNNNNYDNEESPLKIDEDIDPGKENRIGSPMSNDDDIAELDVSNGVSSDEEEEEPPLPGPGVELSDTPRIINPWTGEQIKLSEDHDDSSAQDGDGHLYPSFLDSSLLSRSDTSGESGPRGNGSSICDPPGSDQAAQKYACVRCGRSYLHQATLVRHQRYECGISASYPCSLCGRKFKRRDVLKGHMEKCVNKSSAAAVQAMVMGNSMASAASMAAGNINITSFPQSLSPNIATSLASNIPSSISPNIQPPPASVTPP